MVVQSFLVEATCGNRLCGLTFTGMVRTKDPMCAQVSDCFYNVRTLRSPWLGAQSVVAQFLSCAGYMWQSTLWSYLTGTDQIKVPMRVHVSDRFHSGWTLWSPKYVLIA